MEVDLEGGGFATRGALFPGVPFVVIGRGIDDVWSATSSQADNTDVFIETLCGDDTHYMVKGTCRAMTTFNAGVLSASGAPDQPVVFRETVHGPVEGYATVGGTRVAVSLERSTRGRELLSAAGLLRARHEPGRLGEELREGDGGGRVLVQLVLRRRQGHRSLLERAAAGARARHRPGPADRRLGRLRLARLPHARPARAGDRSRRTARSSTGTTSPPRASGPRTTTGRSGRSSASSSCSGGSTRRRASSRSRTSPRR